MGKGIGCKIYENCGRDCTHCTAEEAKKKAKKMQPRRTQKSAAPRTGAGVGKEMRRGSEKGYRGN